MRLNMTFIGNYSSDVCSSELTAMQRARQKRSMADMRTIATAWESRATEVNQYTAAAAHALPGAVTRSEERRVGKETRVEMAPDDNKKMDHTNRSVDIKWVTTY